jgi:hypothetical protein
MEEYQYNLLYLLILTNSSDATDYLSVEGKKDKALEVIRFFQDEKYEDLVSSEECNAAINSINEGNPPCFSFLNAENLVTWRYIHQAILPDTTNRKLQGTVTATRATATGLAILGAFTQFAIRSCSGSKTETTKFPDGTISTTEKRSPCEAGMRAYVALKSTAKKKYKSNVESCTAS